MEYYKMDADGDAIKCDDIVSAFKDDNRRIMLTTLKNEVTGDTVEISTVFLPIDHAYGDTTGPVLYESMVFGGEYDNDQKRYTNILDAKRGHYVMVRAAYRKEKTCLITKHKDSYPHRKVENAIKDCDYTAKLETINLKHYHMGAKLRG